MPSTSLIADLLLYLVVAGIMAITGLGVLSLLRVRGDAMTSVLLAPLATLALWANALGICVALRFPVSEVAPWVWVGSGALAIYGGLHADRFAEGRLPPDGRHWSAGRTIWLFLACVFVPLILLLPYVVYGFSEYAGSRLPDGWSYVAYGQYLWSVPRGADGGLSPLHQYASHLSKARHVGSSLLGLLSVLTSPGDTQSVTGFFFAVCLFGVSCASAAFARVRGLGVGMAVLYVLVAVLSGWSLNVIVANNYDNLLVLMILPGLAAVTWTMSPNNLGSWIFTGMLVSALVYAYPELGVSACAIWLVMLAERMVGFREKGWFWKALVGASLVPLLLLPYIATIAEFVVGQVGAGLTSGQRAGEGMFIGLLDVSRFPAAFWALGAEDGGHELSMFVTCVGLSLFVLLSAGIVKHLKSRDLGILAALILPLVAAPVLLVWQKYAYGAYKMIVFGWWAVAFVVVSGVTLTSTKSRWRPVILSIPVLVCLAIPVYAATRVVNDVRHTSSGMGRFRVLARASKPLGTAPVGVFVQNWEASQWAIYFLRDHSTQLAIFDGYLAMPHVRAALDRAASVDWRDVRYLLTDSIDPGPVVEAHHWTRIWQSTAYSLWDTQGRPWAIVTKAKTPNGFESVNGQPFFWLGGGATQFTVLANRDGLLQMTMEASWGPAAPQSDTIHLAVNATSGFEALLDIHPGWNGFEIPIRAGFTDITLEAADGLAVPVGVKQSVIRVWKLATTLE